MQVPRIEPFLQCPLVEVGDRASILQCDHFPFGSALRAPDAHRIAAPEDQQRAGFDRDRHLLYHEFRSARSRDSNERSLPKLHVESPSQTGGNFLEFLGIG
jgi:hypothetical protein